MKKIFLFKFIQDITIFFRMFIQIFNLCITLFNRKIFQSFKKVKRLIEVISCGFPQINDHNICLNSFFLNSPKLPPKPLSFRFQTAYQINMTHFLFSFSLHFSYIGKPKFLLFQKFLG